jgi:hypothetical protein
MNGRRIGDNATFALSVDEQLWVNDQRRRGGQSNA